MSQPNLSVIFLTTNLVTPTSPTTIVTAMTYRVVFSSSPFLWSNPVFPPSSLSLTVMDGGLHPFIAFTYFSAHPLNDTHSHTMTSSHFLSIFLKLSSSIPLFLRSSHNWLHFIPSCTLPSSILCTPFFLLPTFTVFHALVSPYLCICCFFPYPIPLPRPCAFYTY